MVKLTNSDRHYMTEILLLRRKIPAQTKQTIPSHTLPSLMFTPHYPNTPQSDLYYPTLLIGVDYSTARVFFLNFPPIPVGQTVLPTAIPLKAPIKHYL